MKKGFTLIEVTIVILILAVLISALTQTYLNFLDAQRLNAAAETAAAMFGKAREYTIGSRAASQAGEQYGVHFHDNSGSLPADEQNEIWILQGTTDAVGNAIERYELPPGILISSMSFPGAAAGKTGVFFDRITGALMVDNGVSVVALSSNATTTFQSSRSGLTRSIIFLPTGVVQLQ